MKLLGKAVKAMGYPLAAIIGVAAAVLLFLSVMVVKIEDGSMLPVIEPGDRVVAVRMDLPVGPAPSLDVGDLVVYRAPYYEIGGKGVCLIRRVSGMNGDMIEVCGEESLAASEKEILSKEKILGKIIYNG